MEEFTHRGKTIEFKSVTGVVMDTDKRSETRISASGGGGYIGPNGGTISDISISASSRTKHEFWIKTEDGSERDIQLDGVDIPLRAGQKITLISAGKKGAKLAWYATLVNHNANKRWPIYTPDELNKLMKLEVFGLLPWVLAVPIWLVVAIVLNSGNAGLWAAGGFLAYWAYLKFTRAKKLRLDLQNHLDKLATASSQQF